MPKTAPRRRPPSALPAARDPPNTDKSPGLLGGLPTAGRIADIAVPILVIIGIVVR
jgi:hypothetical protein